MTTNITDYDEFRAKFSEVKDSCNFLPDVSTDDGYAKSKRISLDVGKILTAVEKTRKELKADSLEYGRRIDSEAKGIVAELESFQLPHKNAYKELDQLKKDRETKRKADLESRVDSIRMLPELMADSDADGVKDALNELSSNECLDFYEYTDQALKARNASKEALSSMFAAKLKQEAEAKELADLRKKQAEQDQKDRDERIAKEASEKAEKEAAQAKAAELAAIELANEAVKQKEAAEKQAIIDAENAAKEAKAAQIKLQEEKEAAEIAETEAREANKKHVGAVRKAAKEDIVKLGVDEDTAKKIVLAINAGDIRNVSIAY